MGGSFALGPLHRLIDSVPAGVAHVVFIAQSPYSFERWPTAVSVRILHRVYDDCDACLVYDQNCYEFWRGWNYGVGVPSGLFVPSLLTGAAFGRIIGQWCAQVGRRKCYVFETITKATAAISPLALL